MNQTDMFADMGGHRDGKTFEPERDEVRLNRQARAVFDVMKDERWHSLSVISASTGEPEASVSARLRDFRKPRFGGWTVNRRYVSQGLWEYQLEDG